MEISDTLSPKQIKLANNKIATMEELGLTKEPTCLSCSKEVDFDRTSRCQFKDIDGRVGSDFGWKMYCCNACKHVHLDKTSDSQKRLNSAAHSQYIVIQKPDGKQILCLGLSGTARKYNFSKSNIVQSVNKASKGYILIARNVIAENYTHLPFENNTLL